MLNSSSTIVALDVGEKRIGVASANAMVRFANPLLTLQNDENIVTEIVKLISKENAALLVVGLPRGMQGQKTTQTTTVEAFVQKIKSQITLPIYWQDESLTSMKAEDELKGRGKSFAKEEVDALAATYILEDFLADHPEIKA